MMSFTTSRCNNDRAAGAAARQVPGLNSHYLPPSPGYDGKFSFTNPEVERLLCGNSGDESKFEKKESEEAIPGGVVDVQEFEKADKEPCGFCLSHSHLSRLDVEMPESSFGWKMAERERLTNEGEMAHAARQGLKSQYAKLTEHVSRQKKKLDSLKQSKKAVVLADILQSEETMKGLQRTSRGHRDRIAAIKEELKSLPERAKQKKKDDSKKTRALRVAFNNVLDVAASLQKECHSHTLETCPYMVRVDGWGFAPSGEDFLHSSLRDFMNLGGRVNCRFVDTWAVGKTFDPVGFTNFCYTNCVGCRGAERKRDKRLAEAAAQRKALALAQKAEAEAKAAAVALKEKTGRLRADLSQERQRGKKLRAFLFQRNFNAIVGAFDICARKLGEMDEKFHLSQRALLQDMCANNKGSKTKRRILARKQAAYDAERSLFIMTTLRSYTPPDSAFDKRVVLPEELIERKVDAMRVNDEPNVCGCNSALCCHADGSSGLSQVEEKSDEDDGFTAVSYSKRRRSKPNSPDKKWSKNDKKWSKNDKCKLKKGLRALKTMEELEAKLESLGLSLISRNPAAVPTGRHYGWVCEKKYCSGSVGGCRSAYHHTSTTLCLHDILYMLGAEKAPCGRRCNCGEIDCGCRWRTDAKRGYILGTCERGAKPQSSSEKIVGPCSYLHVFEETGRDCIFINDKKALPVADALVAYELYLREEAAEKERKAAEPKPWSHEEALAAKARDQQRARLSGRTGQKCRSTARRTSSRSSGKRGGGYYRKTKDERNAGEKKVSDEVLKRRAAAKKKLADENARLQKHYADTKAKHARGEHLTNDERCLLRLPVAQSGNMFDNLSDTDEGDETEVKEPIVVPVRVRTQLMSWLYRAQARLEEERKRMEAEIMTRVSQLDEKDEQNDDWVVHVSVSSKKKARRRARGFRMSEHSSAVLLRTGGVRLSRAFDMVMDELRHADLKKFGR